MVRPNGDGMVGVDDKALHTGQPPYLSELLQHYEPTRTLCHVITKLRTLETAHVRSTVLDFYSADDVSSAKKILLETASYVQSDKPLSRYPERQSTNRMVREMDDVMDILVQIDERKVNCLVHCLVLLLTTLIIYRRLIWMLVKCIPS